MPVRKRQILETDTVSKTIYNVLGNTLARGKERFVFPNEESLSSSSTAIRNYFYRRRYQINV